MKIALITLGCPKNLVDAEIMLGLLDEAGHELVGDPDGADLAVVNTCSFIAAAVEESRGVVERCLDLKRCGATAAVVVAGCLPQRYGEATLALFPDVDGVVGSSAYDEIASVVDRAARGERPLVVREPTILCDHDSPRVLGTPAHLAYIKIAEGCDNRCAYCTIPSIRGPQRSRAPGSVIAEAEGLVASGVRELNLIAQDTSAYGTDIATSVLLPELLHALDACGAPWIRVLYAHPAHVSDELLAAMASERSVVPYIDIPVQHVSKRILQRMGRAREGLDVRAVLSRVRDAVPGIAIRSSVMVGFPGETDREFEELLDFIQAGFVDHVGVFTFSPEAGTRAAGLGGRVNPTTASERAVRVAQEAKVLAAGRAASVMGTDVVVLVDGQGVGRTAGQAWELDGRVILDESPGRDPRAGEFWLARVTGASEFDLTARPVRRLEEPGRAGETA